MTGESADALDDVKTVLTNSWTIANTDSKIPEFHIISDGTYRRLDLGMYRAKDWVLIYLTSEIESPNGIGGSEWKVISNVSLDIRIGIEMVGTVTGKAHFKKVKREVERIIRANVKNPTANFQYLLPKSFMDLSDKSIKLWRGIKEIEMHRPNLTS